MATKQRTKRAAATIPPPPKPPRAPEPQSPFPDAMESGFVVKASDAAGVDLKKKVMQVPMGDSPNARHARLHEMGHLAWTPKESASELAKRYRVAEPTLQACEDARVNMNLLTAVDDAGGGAISHDDIGGISMWFANVPDEGQVYASALALVSLTGTAALPGFEGILPLVAGSDITNQAMAIAEKVRSTIKGNRFSSVVAAARLLEREAKYVPPRSRSYGGWGTLGGNRSETRGGEGFMIRPGSGMKSRAGDADDSYVVPGTYQEQLELRAGYASDRKLAEYGWVREDGCYMEEDDDTQSGTMTIESVPLPLGRKTENAARKRVASSTGKILGRISRVLTDGMVFQRSKRRRKPGGTCLIDVSGSMSLSMGDVERLVEESPMGTVAIYSGYRDTPTTGELIIIAEKGRRAELDKVRYGGGNVVDIPALEWLAKQEAPRVWVCDGGVTGEHDQGSVALAREALRLCVRHQIKRLDYVEQAVTYLAEQHAADAEMQQ